MNTFMIGRLYGFGAIRQLACCWKGIVSTIVMGTVIFIVNLFIESNLLNLIIGIIFGVLIYLIMLLILREEELTWILLSIRNKIKKNN